MLPHKAPTNIRLSSHQKREAGLLRRQLYDTGRVANRGPENANVEFTLANSDLKQFTSCLVPLHSKFPFSSTFCLSSLCNPGPWENAFKKAFPGNEASTNSTNVVIWQHQVSRKSAALIFEKARTHPSLPLTWSRAKTKQEQSRTPSLRGIKQSYEESK